LSYRSFAELFLNKMVPAPETGAPKEFVATLRLWIGPISDLVSGAHILAIARRHGMTMVHG
jgi:hypothetical protein